MTPSTFGDNVVRAKVPKRDLELPVGSTSCVAGARARASRVVRAVGMGIGRRLSLLAEPREVCGVRRLVRPPGNQDVSAVSRRPVGDPLRV